MTRFELGRVVATPGCLAVLTELGLSPAVLLARHASGDWGDMSEGDKQANERALVDGSRVFSGYKLANGERLWVITEATDDSGQRGSTCLLLPSEY